MALPTTGTRSTGALPSTAVVGLREDLSDQIYNVDPMDFNFLERAPRGPKPKAVYYEWEMDYDEEVLTASASDDQEQYYGHAVPEGETPSFRIEAQPVRIGNILQINRESLKQSETTNAVAMAGRGDEFSRRMEKKIRNLKRKMEYSLWRNGYPHNSTSSWTTRNPDAVPSNDNQSIRRFGGIKAFVRTNVDTALSSNNSIPALIAGLPLEPAGSSHETLVDAGGNNRSLTEQRVNKLLDKVYNSIDEGGTFDVYMGTFNKRKFSRFAGIVDIEKDIGADLKSTIVGSADVYVDENYTLVAYTSRHISPNDMAFMDWEAIDVCYLREMGGKELPSGGDYRAWMMNVEWGFRVHNERSLAWLGKLTTS